MNARDFQKASPEEKAYHLPERPSTTFFKDGIKRLFRNKIATISMVVVLLITLASVILPWVWPYSYSKRIRGSTTLYKISLSRFMVTISTDSTMVVPMIMG